MQAFLEYVLRYLVDYPEEVVVTRVQKEKGTLFELRMRPSDVGKVVGKQGQTIAAIRNIINAALPKGAERIEVEIVEPV
jgi:predicted RNA-binding protein YlqC (UPF0109 family)